MSKDPASQRMEKIVSLCKRRGLHLPVLRDLRRPEWLLGLRTARRRAEAQPEGLLVAPQCTRTRRHGRHGWLDHHEPRGLKASGHEETFSDPMVDCKSCKARHRADQLPEKDGTKYCPNCGSRDLTEPRAFNLMFKSYAGPAGERRQSRVSPPRDGAGDVRAIPQRARHLAPEAALWHRADRQGVSQ